MLSSSGSIPRSATYPFISSPGGSPRQRQRRRSWDRLTGSLQLTTDSLCSPGRSSTRIFLLVLAALYAAALLSLPVLYASSSRLLSGPHSSEPSNSDQQLASAGSRLPQLSMKANRRLALQRVAGSTLGSSSSAGLLSEQNSLAAAELERELEQQPQQRPLWPDTGLAQLNYGAKTAGLPRVEYRDAGFVVLLQDALNASRWGEQPLYQASPLPHPVALTRHGQPSAGASAAGNAGSSASAKFPPSCPQGDIRLFIGVTSRCCTAEAQAKRAALRRTWVQQVRDHHPNVVIRFILAQPVDEGEVAAAVSLLKNEIQQHADMIIVPGHELYRYLPNKTLQLLRYALSSACKFTHVMKTDDDVYVRPQRLMDVITTGQHNFSLPVQYDGSGTFDGKQPGSLQAPWMSGMYVGALDSNQSGIFPGWAPNRHPDSKWYLSEEDLPDALCPLGVRWVSGWGYVLSRDLAEFVTNTALMYAAIPSKKPVWWGRLPWEDIMVGALLADVAQVHHHYGFKAAWQECDSNTVLKHLDNDAPTLQEGLHAQELNGLWARKSIVCSSGTFELGNYTQWRTWRNSLPDNQIGGFM